MGALLTRDPLVQADGESILASLPRRSLAQILGEECQNPECVLSRWTVPISTIVRCRGYRKYAFAVPPDDDVMARRAHRSPLYRPGV